MPSPIDSMDDLPQDIQDKESSTFDFKTVRQLLIAGYYTGPTENQGKGKGLRQFALQGKPGSHRTSILRKAKETDILEETPEGYATSQRGFSLLQKITSCSRCGSDMTPFNIYPTRGRGPNFVSVAPICASCEAPTDANNVDEFERDDNSLEKAIKAIENHNVECYLNGKSVSQVKADLGI